MLNLSILSCELVLNRAGEAPLVVQERSVYELRQA